MIKELTARAKSGLRFGCAFALAVPLVFTSLGTPGAVSGAQASTARPATTASSASTTDASSTAGAASATSVQTTIDSTDPTAANNPAGVDTASGLCYPGCRGAAQLVVYTAASGRATTGSNDFGFEVTVEADRVVSRGGSNSPIPQDGVVLSGHGSRGTWLSTHGVIGALVKIEGTTLTVTIDDTTHVLGATRSLEGAQSKIVAAEESCLSADLPGAQTAAAESTGYLTDARAALEAGDGTTAVTLAEQARQSAELAGFRTAESRPVEGRGVWVRPTETTPAQIDATLDSIEAAGFNMVFLETVWQGYTIYPSAVAASNGIAPQRPEMIGFDPLEVWISGAHARGIELHPWVHTFFVGADSTGGPGPILTAHPEWAAVEREDVGAVGPRPSSLEPGYYFVDPALPEPRAYVASLFREIMTGYDVDGLHLDYIRYPVSLPWETASFSYSDDSRAAFSAEHGVDPYELRPTDALWVTWNSWRENKVTTFVSEVRDIQKAVAPDIQVSAAVFPDPSDSLGKKFQNWADWVDKGYVDVLTGMSFGTTAASVARDTRLMRAEVGDDNLLYTATYGPFRGSTPDVMTAQVESVRAAGSDGAALFAWNQATASQKVALEEGVFRTSAMTPHSDLVAAARAGTASSRAAIGAASGSCLPHRTARELDRDLRAADGWLRSGNFERARSELTEATTRVESAADVQPAFAARVARDLRMFERWTSQAAKSAK